MIALRPKIKSTDLPGAWLWIICVFAGLMLFATIFYPFGYDQAAFTVGGEMVTQHGAVPYRDLLDTKPPLIFFIYGISSILFGHHVWSIRLLDFVYQVITAVVFYRILRDYLPRHIAMLAPMITIIEYAASGYWMTAQSESFATLPSLFVVSATIRAATGELSARRSPFVWGLLAGLGIGIVFLLKYTLAALLPSLVIFALLRREWRGRWTYLIGVFSGFAVICLLYVLYLLATGAFTNFELAMRWVSEYGAIDPLFSIGTITGIYSLAFPEHMITIYTPTMIVLGVVCIGWWINASGDAEQRDRDALLMLLAIIGCFQLLGTLYERKLFYYHYTRAFWAFAPFIAIGYARVAEKLGEWWQAGAGGIMQRGLVVCIVIVMAFYSPISRVATQSIRWPLDAFHDTAPADVQQRVPDYFADDQVKVGAYIQQHTTPRESIFFWGNDAGVYFYSKKLPTTICLTATPLRTSWTPEVWKREMLTQLGASRPAYFISEYGDPKQYITGSKQDSYQALLAWHDLAEYLTQYYEPDTTIGNFYLYRRKAVVIPRS